jgi:ferritin-like metal-binding protein YciE
MEKQALRLLAKGAEIAATAEISEIYRDHLLQTQEHARAIEGLLEAQGETPSKLKDAGMEASGIGLAAIVNASADSSIRLATSTYAFENLEIAAYQLLIRMARRAGLVEAAEVLSRILEEEEAAAELIAGTFEQTIDFALGDPSGSPNR